MTDIIHIVIARKPIDGTIVENCIKHGCGVLNIDKCRINTKGEYLGDPNRFYGADNSTRPEWHRPHMTNDVMALKHKKSFERLTTFGRFPANIIHDGSKDVIDLFDDTKQPSARKARTGNDKSGWGIADNGEPFGYTDVGSTARFFFNIGQT